MKMISILLAIIILSLTAMPCCAEEGNCQEELHACEAETDHSEPNEESNFPCSPFYSCGACSGFSLLSFKLSNTDNPISEFASISSFYQLSLSETYKLALLKPPKQI